jgi:hypothetical protein
MAVGWLTESRRTPHQSGKIALDEQKIECLFVTLDKAEGYHDRISYHDYAISPEIFHWQTQNNAGPDTPAGRRYIESPENRWRFFLFVRENKEAAYCALGPATRFTSRATGRCRCTGSWKSRCRWSCSARLAC